MTIKDGWEVKSVEVDRLEGPDSLITGEGLFSKEMFQLAVYAELDAPRFLEGIFLMRFMRADKCIKGDPRKVHNLIVEANEKGEVLDVRPYLEDIEPRVLMLEVLPQEVVVTWSQERVERLEDDIRGDFMEIANDVYNFYLHWESTKYDLVLMNAKQVRDHVFALMVSSEDDAQILCYLDLVERFFAKNNALVLVVHSPGSVIAYYSSEISRLADKTSTPLFQDLIEAQMNQVVDIDSWLEHKYPGFLKWYQTVSALDLSNHRIDRLVR